MSMKDLPCQGTDLDLWSMVTKEQDNIPAITDLTF